MAVDVRTIWVEFDTLASVLDSRVSWVEFDTLATVLDTRVSWIEFDVEAEIDAGAQHGFIITDTAPRLWWQRKPKKITESEAEQSIAKVARKVERIVRAYADIAPKEALRIEAHRQIAPMLEEMPGFNWLPMFNAILIQVRMEQQRRDDEDQAGILAAFEIDRIRRMRDEEAILVLLMGG